VGDAIGLPYEGLSKRRGIRLLGAPDRHRFLFGRGMVSDDTEHTCMVAMALCQHPADAAGFASAFARHLRWWLLGLPAGIGWATLRATMRLWLGFPPTRSGVFSAGNGPAMRSAILGACIEDVGMLRQFVRASTIITHTDPRATEGAVAVALAAWCAKKGINGIAGFLERYHTAVECSTSEFSSLMANLGTSLESKETTENFAARLGCAAAVSGYVCHTVPVALHAWLRHPDDFVAAVTDVIRCGGDTDTTGAIVGALVGAGVGASGIPTDWLGGLWEWPRSEAWMERLAHAVTQAVESGQPVAVPRVVPVVGLARNVVFASAVIGHALRRLLPPY
jgi:ADP-ribosylglycohydrolase